MRRLRMGLIGPGFIATHHIDAVRRLGDVDVVAIAGSSQRSAERRAAELRVPKAYGKYMDLIRDPDIDVIHNTTPNHLHFPVGMAAIEAGKHVISDKPLAVSVEEARQLRDAALRSRRSHVVMFNYRGSAMVQQARCMVENGEIGKLHFIQGCYLQDWMIDAGIYSWRSDPAKGGVSSALGDIGSHWCDLAQHVSGQNIQSVLADLTTVVPIRYEAGTPSSGLEEKVGIAVPGEDLASALVRFEDGTRGCFSVAQVVAGHGNDLKLELNGRSGSLRWEQEQSEHLWVGRHGEPNTVIDKDPAQVTDSVKRWVKLPYGHHAGWADSMLAVMQDAYEWIRSGSDLPTSRLTATFDDGYRICCVIEAMLQSHAAGGVWNNVAYVPPPLN